MKERSDRWSWTTILCCVLVLAIFGVGGYVAYDLISESDVFKQEKKPWNPTKREKLVKDKLKENLKKDGKDNADGANS